MSEQPKPKPKAKKVLKLKKNYSEFGQKGDPVTPEILKVLKAKGIKPESIAE